MLWSLFAEVSFYKQQDESDEASKAKQSNS